jgi:hypothetical protein
MHDVHSGADGWVLVAGVVLVAGGLSVILVSARVRPVNELWIVTNGRHVCLFRDPDRRIFGQVRRALTRALECAR